MKRLTTTGIEATNKNFVPVYTWATLPKQASRYSYALVADTLIGCSGIWLLEFRDDLDGTYPWRNAGGNTSLPATYVSTVTTAAGNNSANLANWVTPVAGVADFVLSEHVGTQDAGGSGYTAKLGTTNGGTEIGSINGGNTAASTTISNYTFAKGVTHYLNYAANSPNYFSYQRGATLQMILKKCAGNV